LIEIVSSTIAAEPMARVDYISLNDAEDFQPLVQVEDRPALLSVAVYIGKTRLIDNMVLGVNQKQGAAAV
jgi:pantoate--beta-alanine ligase